MSRDNRQSYFDPYFDEWFNRDDPYRCCDTGSEMELRPRVAYKRSLAPVSQDDFSAADARLENFYASML